MIQNKMMKMMMVIIVIVIVLSTFCVGLFGVNSVCVIFLILNVGVLFFDRAGNQNL